MGEAVVAILDMAADISIRVGTAICTGFAVRKVAAGWGLFGKICVGATGLAAGYFASEKLVDYSKCEIRKLDAFLRQKIEKERIYHAN